MEDDLSPVGHLIHIVHRGPRDLDAVVQRRLVNPQAVIALAAEGGDQGGVDVDDALIPSCGEVRAEDAHKARQDDHLYPGLFQFPADGSFKRFLGSAVLPAYRDGFYARLLRPLQGIGPGIAGENKDDFPVFQLSLRLGVQQGLKIGASAGHKHSNFRFQHICTLSSLSTMLPMM